MVVFDATVLSLLLNPSSRAPTDQETGKPIERAADRIDNLIADLDKRKTRIIIPTPVLCEVLVHAGMAGATWIEKISRASCFRISSFDQRAAVEAATLIRDARSAVDKRDGANVPWQKVKFDRQIVAIAKVEKATTIYSDDGDIARYARPLGIDVIKTAELPLPEESSQLPLQFPHTSLGTPTAST